MRYFIHKIVWRIENELGETPDSYEVENIRERLNLPETEIFESDVENSDVELTEKCKMYLHDKYKFPVESLSTINIIEVYK